MTAKEHWYRIGRPTPSDGGPGEQAYHAHLWQSVSEEQLIFLFPALARKEAMAAYGAEYLLRRLPASIPEPRDEQSLGLLKDRLRAMSAGTAKPARFTNVSWLEAVHASYVAEFNSAYAFTEHAYAHDALAASAWVRRYKNGRASELSTALAASVQDILQHLPGIDARASASIREVTEIALRGGRHRGALSSVVACALYPWTMPSHPVHSKNHEWNIRDQKSSSRPRSK